jgi:hypothetical protein
VFTCDHWQAVNWYLQRSFRELVAAIAIEKEEVSSIFL